jgi:hypothetical protein
VGKDEPERGNGTAAAEEQRAESRHLMAACVLASLRGRLLHPFFYRLGAARY